MNVRRPTRAFLSGIYFIEFEFKIAQTVDLRIFLHFNFWFAPSLNAFLETWELRNQCVFNMHADAISRRGPYLV